MNKTLIAFVIAAFVGTAFAATVDTATQSKQMAIAVKALGDGPVPPKVTPGTPKRDGTGPQASQGKGQGKNANKTPGICKQTGQPATAGKCPRVVAPSKSKAPATPVAK